MPYTKQSLPPAVKKLPAHAQDIWMSAFNSAWDEYEGDEEKTHATAWAAVKNVYEQDEKGDWRKKPETHSATDADKKAQQNRASKHGISIKDGGHVTKPSEWSSVPDGQFADPVNYRYPMPDEEHARAAWSYWNKPKNQEQYNDSEAAKITARIKARCKSFGIKIAEDQPAKVVGQDLSAFVSLASVGDVWNDAWGSDPASRQSLPPEWIRVLPLGKVLLNDDRQPFTVSPDSIKKILDKFSKNAVDMVIDYEHQTMSGDKAPAAGWVKELKEREDGLWAYVQWTDTAKDHIKSKEYRYYSPTVRLDSQRNVQELLHIGLTNFPAIAGIPPLTLKKNKDTQGGDKKAMLESLIRVLGLEEDANETDVVMMVRDLMDVKKICDGNQSKIDELKGKVEQLSSNLTDAELRAVTAESNLNKIAVPMTVIEALGIKKDSTIHDIVLRIDGLKMGNDRAKELESELTALKGQHVKSAAEQMIEEALKTGRTSPAELEKNDGKLRKIAESDPEFFRSFVLDRPEYSVVPLASLPKDVRDKTKAKLDTGLTPAEEKLLETAGITLEQYKAQKELEQSGKPFAGY